MHLRPVSVLALAAVVSLLSACATTSPGPAEDEGTLGRIRKTGTLRLGYRESSRPFSFVGDDGRPAGYSVDLCEYVAGSIARRLALADLKTTWVKVSVADRMDAIANGTIDLECGSTTASLTRYERVDFSVTTFVDGGSLLVTDASGITDVATLANRRVAIIPGTTTETALREVLRRRLIPVTVVPVNDHAAGVAALDDDTADAYASDHSILVGVGRTSRRPEGLSLIDEFFSYEPYGLMLRRGDPAFRLAVNRALAELYRSGEVIPVFEKWFESIRTAMPLIRAMYILNALPE
ncbi:MAG TPA: amino acid ABC transporter substrate-binding protein [Methylomirabilota bacterium]|jgi:ABC-type amino acid transport substrate-binding protein|nr:amino acid ABC transporter substrate-binding protein [Methylomirabilota bacterium]